MRHSLASRQRAALSPFCNLSGASFARIRCHPRGICYPRSMTTAAALTRLARLTLFLLLVATLLLPPARSQQASSAAAPTVPGPSADFAVAADEVLHNMSEITGLSLISPLKKTLRSRDEIRAYVIKQMEDD